MNVYCNSRLDCKIDVIGNLYGACDNVGLFAMVQVVLPVKVPPTCVPTSPTTANLLFGKLIWMVKNALVSNSAMSRSSFLCLWILKGNQFGYGAPSFIVYLD